jgi:hypothetical protein
MALLAVQMANHWCKIVTVASALISTESEFQERFRVGREDSDSE